MTRSILELKAICKEYPFNSQKEDIVAVVDEWLSMFSDLSDFWALYIAGNKDQQQKVLEKAIDLCETTSDVDEIQYYYQEGSDLYQALMTKRATLPQDADADI